MSRPTSVPLPVLTSICIKVATQLLNGRGGSLHYRTEKQSKSFPPSKNVQCALGRKLKWRASGHPLRSRTSRKCGFVIYGLETDQVFIVRSSDRLICKGTKQLPNFGLQACLTDSAAHWDYFPNYHRRSGKTEHSLRMSCRCTTICKMRTSVRRSERTTNFLQM